MAVCFISVAYYGICLYVEKIYKMNPFFLLAGRIIEDNHLNRISPLTFYGLNSLILL